MESEILISYGGAIKAIERKGDLVTVGAHGVLWGDATRADLSRDWFTPSTYFGASRGLGVKTLLHHGRAIKGLEQYAAVEFPPTIKAEEDEDGLFVAVLLDARVDYERRLLRAMDKGALHYSGGADTPLVRYKSGKAWGQDTGELAVWPLVEFSFTPTPCEPRMTAIGAVKSLGEAHDYDDEAMAEWVADFNNNSFSRAVPLDLSGAAKAIGDPAPIFGDMDLSELGAQVLSNLSERLRYQVFYEAFSPATPPQRFGLAMVPAKAPTKAERLDYLERGLSEFQRLALRIAGAILDGSDGGALAAKAFEPSTPSLDILDAGQLEGSRFVEHSDRLLAAEQEFVSRSKGISALAVKSGRVFSQANLEMLRSHLSGLQELASGIEEIVSTHTPSEDSADEAAKATPDPTLLQELTRHEVLRAQELGAL